MRYLLVHLDVELDEAVHKGGVQQGVLRVVAPPGRVAGRHHVPPRGQDVPAALVIGPTVGGRLVLDELEDGLLHVGLGAEDFVQEEKPSLAVVLYLRQDGGRREVGDLLLGLLTVAITFSLSVQFGDERQSGEVRRLMERAAEVDESHRLPGAPELLAQLGVLGRLVKGQLAHDGALPDSPFAQ